MTPPAVNPVIGILMLVPAAGLFAAMAAMCAVSLHERERTAAYRSLLLALVLPAPFLAAGLFDFPGVRILRILLIALVVAGLLIYLLPLRGARPRRERPAGRLDERDIMFSRAALEPGTERFEAHYRRRPAHREPDDRFRARPGLLDPGSRHHHDLGFAAARASFDTVEALHPLVEGTPALEPGGAARIPPSDATVFIKSWARRLGAVDVGVTELQDHHLYSHVGRGDRWGESVDLDHKYAIAVTVEMDKAMLDCAPYAPTIMESARKYMDSGAIAVQLAVMIRALGHRARAHIDANYRVVCPLVARDAGLGEIGRMGLLMTPRLGPRVRLAVVTTDMSLDVDRPTHDTAILDFCDICRKCADICPARAIPHGGRREIDGVLRWRIDSEACFSYWCTIGTDCGRCIRVCPFSHPDNILHELIRRGVRRSAPFRRLALLLDDYFYGRRPAPAPPPDWTIPDRANGDLSGDPIAGRFRS